MASSENSCLDFFEVNHELLERAGSEANPDKLRRVGYVTRIEDAVSQIDWSTNSQYIRVRCDDQADGRTCFFVGDDGGLSGAYLQSTARRRAEEQR